LRGTAPFQPRKAGVFGPVPGGDKNVFQKGKRFGRWGKKDGIFPKKYTRS